MKSKLAPQTSLPSEKYHVALSFAGEDRAYVEEVAVSLKSFGVEVFYDRFEEAELWGKDLFAHLSDIYENKAIFTIMFVSAAYRDKMWPNHERQSAQARAISSKREYILPAFFDESIAVPGLRKTTGHISLKGKSPESLAKIIVKKLSDFGVELSEQFAYSEDAKADVDFPRGGRSPFASIVNDLKSYTWGTQNPAMFKLLNSDLSSFSSDQLFVLGRNIYQVACGNEHKAVSVVVGLRDTLASLDEKAALHLLNGMFYEVYFNKEGNFRGGGRLKAKYLHKLLQLQTVKKYEPCITFIRRALQPYKNSLPFLPSTVPEMVTFDLVIKRGDPPLIKSLKVKEVEILVADDLGQAFQPNAWKISLSKFTLKKFEKFLAENWDISPAQVKVQVSQKLDPETEFRLPKDSVLYWRDISVGE